MKPEEILDLHEMERSSEEIIAETRTIKAEAEALAILLSLTIQDGEMSNRRAKMIAGKIKHLQNKAQNIHNTEIHIWETWQKIRRAEQVDN